MKKLKKSNLHAYLTNVIKDTILLATQTTERRSRDNSRRTHVRSTNGPGHRPV